ncbi:MAG: tetratricopeptide repeat protein [Pseudomonadota bacterium]|nr:tetratricopeptide repeat protein [Pseudomonadota bacterium]
MHTLGKLLSAALIASLVAGCGGAEERRARYVEKGESFFAAHNYEKARVEFRNALQIEPNDVNARYQLGRVSEKLSNPREAVGHYQVAIDQDPNFMPARAALARLFLLGGVPDRAMELVAPGLTQEPQNAQLLTVRGAAKAQLGDVPGAFEDAEAAAKLAPDDEYAIALLASLYRQNARSDKAIEIVTAGVERVPGSVDLRVVLADLLLAQKQLPEAEAQLQKVIELQPEDLSHRYRLARFHMLAKNVAAAEQTMRDAIAAKPDSIEAKVALADLLASHGSADKAEAELRKFAAEEKDGAGMQLALARFYESQRKSDDARNVYREIIKDQETRPDGLTARNRLATLLLQKEDAKGATALIEEVLKENPRDNDALVLRGNLALVRGDAPAAIADLRAVLRDQPNSVPVQRALARAHLQNNELALAEETLRSAAQSNPGDKEVRLELSQLLTQSGRPEQARPVLEQLVKESPSDVSTLEALFRVQASLKDLAAARATAENIKQTRPDLPLGWYLEGAISEAEKNYDAAEAAYQRALQIQPSAGEPLTALVRVDATRKQVPKALARLDKVLAEHPDNAIAHNLKGELLATRGELPAAAAAFNEAIAKAPKWWMPYRGLALSHLAGKRNDDAVQVLEDGLAKTGAVSLGTDLAALYERLNRPDDAIRVYETLAGRQPDSVAVANNLAMLLVSYRSDPTSLTRAAELAGKLDHVSEPSILNTRGWVKFKRGEFQESLALLQQAVEKSPESPVMRYHLGMAQLKTGDRAAAEKNLEAAVSSGRQFQGAQEAQAALQQIKTAG